MIAVFALAPRLSSGVRKILETSGRGTAKYLVASIARETVVRDTRYNSLFDSANGSAKAARSVSLASTASEPSPKWKAFVRFSPLVRKDEWCLAWIFAWINPSDTEQAERESPGDVQPRLCVWGMALGEEILRFLQPFLGLLAFAIVYKTCVHLKRKIWIASHQRRFAGRAHLVSHLQLIQRDLDEEELVRELGRPPRDITVVTHRRHHLPEMRGSGGLNSQALRKLRQYTFNKAEMKADECTVCMEDFETGEMITELPMCGHTFHKDCVDLWLRQHASCPICRRNTSDALKEEEETQVDSFTLSESFSSQTTVTLSASNSTSVGSQYQYQSHQEGTVSPPATPRHPHHTSPQPAGEPTPTPPERNEMDVRT